MNVIVGLTMLILGGISAGSSYVPLKGVKGWAWESLWAVQGLGGVGKTALVAVVIANLREQLTGGVAVVNARELTDSTKVLEELVKFFGCGTVRPKGPNSSVATYAVDSLRTLDAAVLPFFEEHPLVIKDRDFRLFAGIVRAMRRKEHLDRQGFERLVRLAYSMNEHGKQRARRLDEIIVGSSETARQAPLGVVPDR